MNEPKQMTELETEYELPDHWNYKSDPYELRKYEQTLALIPAGRFRRALEIGCSEGIFTRQLAPLADHVLGLDIVPVALERARTECDGLTHVGFRHFDLDAGTLDERFDLILCAEVLYYLPWTRLRPAVRKIVGWLHPGGYLVAVHAKNSVVVDWGFGPRGAELLHPLFERPGVRRVREQHEEGYTLSLFQKVADIRRSPWRERIEDVGCQNYPALVRAGLRRARAQLRPRQRE